MDPITQGLLGASTTQALLTKKLGNKAWKIGLFAGMAADLDLLIRSAHDPLFSIIYHRHFTHALAFIPIGGVIIGSLFLLFLRISFKDYRPQWKWILLASIIGYATHGLLDACTSYGTVLFWPFSDRRIAWDIISIIDPIFSLILLIGVAWSAASVKATPARIALLCALIYLGFGFFQHQRAVHLQMRLAQQRQHVIKSARVMPTLANLLLWRSVYVSENQLYFDGIMTPISGESYPYQHASSPLFDETQLPEFVKQSSTLLKNWQVFYWFSDYMVGMASRKPLILFDARYLGNLEPLTSLWGIKFPNPGEGDYVSWVRGVVVK